MKQVNLLVMPTINKDNIFREYELIFKELKKQNGSKKARKYMSRSFFMEVRRIISGLPKAQLRSFAENTSEFLGKLQSEGLLDLRNFSEEEGYDLMRLLYDVQGFYEDKIQADTPRMAMEFMFPYHMFPQGSKVVIYGAGNVGRLIYRQAVHDGYVKIVGIVDKNYGGMSAPDLPVKPVREIKKMTYDYVLISIRESKVAYAIRKDLGKLGIPDKKVKWDGKAVFRDEFYKNLYFPLLGKFEGKYSEHESFLKNISLRANNSEKNINYGYLKRIKPILEAMPESNGSRYYKPFEETIGWITDPFAYNAYAGTALGVLINPNEWKKQIDKIDWLFVVTGWRGFNNEWVGFAYPGTEKQDLICRIVEECNKRDIPTVFYSKEDPVSYNQYIKIAERCLYIFTSAEEKVSEYKSHCKHERVYCLNFGINPNVHNPIGMKKFSKMEDVLFAGAWYDMYPERCKDTETIFDGVLQSGHFLRIIDRFLLTERWVGFPDKYKMFLVPPIEHRLLQKVHKLYNWSINVNTVKNSQTMFAARAYELMAIGNMIISNYSMGINSLLPEVFLCQDSKEIPAIINSMTPEELYKRQIAGIRFVYKGNTCYDRMNQILDVMGKGTEIPKYKVAVVVECDDDKIKEMFKRQTYPVKELILENLLVEKYAEYDLIAFFKKGSYYGDFYLEDMINAFKYTDSDYVTKDGYLDGDKYVYGTEHDYVSVMPDKYRTVFWAENFTAKKLLGIKKNVSLPNGYSIDHFMYNEKQIVPAKCEVKPILSVVVPVYNNGMHLFGKAFASLRRSSIFYQMEILLIDDGSTDEYTPAVIRTLKHDYPNVMTYFYNDGGSGSASRPRNQGVRMASAEYIAFLDPDDETGNDAYAKMLAIAKEEKHDLVVGSAKIFEGTERIWNIEPIVYEKFGSDVVSGGKSFVEKLDFKPMRLHSMIMKKSLLSSNEMEQVEGGIGEDTLFTMQLFYYAEKIKFVSLVSNVYYATRTGSVVNEIDKSFFEKSLLTEQKMVSWLKSTDLLTAYMKVRFNWFFKVWYLNKLNEVTKEKELCHSLLMKIYKLYEKYYDKGDNEINEFVKSL